MRLPQVGLFADGVAVKQVGEETFRLCRELVDDMVLVDNDDICAAIKDVFEDTRTILEPAGALAVAGAKAWVEKRSLRGRTLVAVACGANMNFDRLRFVAERAEVGEHREAILAVTIPEQPGQLQALLRADRHAQRDRVQLPLRRSAARAGLRRPVHPQPRGDAQTGPALATPRPGHARLQRQRNGQAARSPHGGRTVRRG